jgi:peptide deformylase|tara:strand:+ start:87 stop:662 length:576 start_codon:yes stop_codon:yes gene_type:complete
MITKNIKELNQPCEPCSSVNEGEEIAAKLLKELTISKNGIGLAANQIGIQKRVCVINVKEEPVVLINPKIVDKSKETFIFPEGCLSFPNKHVRTKRNVEITVEADNHESKLMFSADSKDLKDALECACIQHEIDHLDGITMFDRQFIPEPIVRKSEKIGRNEKVKITNGSETKMLKYKKAEPLLESGWEMV